MAEPAGAAAAGELAPLAPADGGKTSRGFWLLRALGPGLFVCLADTDAGCLIVAAQSGARWGYSLLLLQVLLIPVLFLAQELTVRLGVYTRQGHTACIREHFGPCWAWFATTLLVLECVAAMVSEMSGVAVVAEIWGLHRAAAALLAAAVIAAVVLLCSYRQIEAVGIALGLFELVFVATMCVYHPRPRDVLHGATQLNSDPEFIGLVAANIGAVVMPWMIYFQQSAIVARGLRTKDNLREESATTLVGSIVTQLVMIGALVTLAASAHVGSLESVGEIVEALTPAMGHTAAKVSVSLGFLGGSLCASFVVPLAASWAVCEAMGEDAGTSLDRGIAEAPLFYGCFLGILALGAFILIAGVNVVRLNVMVELLDGLLLPFAIGFLFLLSTGEALPPEARIRGLHKALLGTIFSLVVAVSSCSAVYSMLGGAGTRE